MPSRFGPALLLRRAALQDATLATAQSQPHYHSYKNQNFSVGDYAGSETKMEFRLGTERRMCGPGDSRCLAEKDLRGRITMEK